MTRYSVALTLIILASFPAHSECIDIWDETTTKRANELRGIALNMLDAEGDNCIDIKKRTERSACQCSYRQQDLIKFRSAYKAFLTDYPQYNGKGLCFTDTNNQGAWINLVAYNKMEKWCL